MKPRVSLLFQRKFARELERWVGWRLEWSEGGQEGVVVMVVVEILVRDSDPVNLGARLFSEGKMAGTG
jgi:hypothetical protein